MTTGQPLAALEAWRQKTHGQRRAGLPPNDVAAEEAVLAALLLDDEACVRVHGLVEAGDFFREHNGWIFAAAMTLWLRGEPVTIPTVAHELDRAGRLDAVGAEPYLVDLVGKYFTAVGVEAHARIVARDALYRRGIHAASEIASLMYEGGPDADAVLGRSEALLLALRMGRTTGQAIRSVDELVDALMAGEMEHRVSSGFASIDRMTRGLRLGQVSVWGGRQDSGKSALMMSAAYSQAFNHGIPVLYLPFEDTVDEVLVRLAGGLMGKSWDTAYKQAQAHAISAAEWAEYRRQWSDPTDGALAALRGLPLHFPEVGSLPSTWDDLLMLVRLSALQHGTQVVYIDYLDVAPKPARKGQSTADLVSQQMADLQALAVRHGIHIVAGSQVSNEGERDDGGKYPPKAHRLLDSGAKARVARMILMIALQPLREASHHRRVMQVAVEKLKGYSVARMVETPAGTPALYLDMLTGLVREVEG